jgi:hypothetical protein
MTDSVFQEYKAGRLDRYIAMGIIRSSVIEYCRLFEHYQELRDRGMNYTGAVEQTAEDLFTTVSTVKRAIANVM